VRFFSPRHAASLLLSSVRATVALPCARCDRLLVSPPTTLLVLRSSEGRAQHHRTRQRAEKLVWGEAPRGRELGYLADAEALAPQRCPCFCPPLLLCSTLALRVSFLIRFASGTTRNSFVPGSGQQDKIWRVRAYSRLRVRAGRASRGRKKARPSCLCNPCGRPAVYRRGAPFGRTRSVWAASGEVEAI